MSLTNLALSIQPWVLDNQLCCPQVAKRKLTQSCHGLVYKAVTPYSKQQQVPVDDLMMAGLHGLHIGVQKFDPARGNRLSTVAYMWISAKVRAAFREMAGGIWIPARTRADVSNCAHLIHTALLMISCLLYDQGHHCSHT